MGRLGSLVFLITLAVSAAGLPRQMKRLAGLLSAPTALSTRANAPAPLPALPPAAQVRFSPQDVDDHSRELLASLTPETQVIMNPIMAKILSASKPAERRVAVKKARFVLAAHGAYKAHKNTLVGVVWTLPAFLLTLATIAFLTGQKGWGRALAATCGSLARKWLVLISLLSVALFVFLHVNAGSMLSAELWAVPAVAALASAGLLRLIDMNVPVWNSTVLGLLAPIAACGVIMVWVLVIRIFSA